MKWIEELSEITVCKKNTYRDLPVEPDRVPAFAIIESTELAFCRQQPALAITLSAHRFAQVTARTLRFLPVADPLFLRPSCRRDGFRAEQW
jgi:hypothetical protein